MAIYTLSFGDRQNNMYIALLKQQRGILSGKGASFPYNPYRGLFYQRGAPNTALKAHRYIPYYHLLYQIIIRILASEHCVYA